MRIIKQELYFPVIITIHFIFWTVDLYFYNGNFIEKSSDTLLFGELNNVSWFNIHRILGEVFSSWVVTVFAFNFLMATRLKWVEKIFGGLDKMYMIHRRSGVIAIFLLLAHFITVPRDLTEFTPGKPMGFYALVLILIGVIISAAPALKRKIPYHKWINIHKLMGVFYTMGVIHGLMVHSLIKELPITRVYVFGMAFVGILAWVYRAFLYNLFNKKYHFVIDQIKNLGFGLTELKLNPVSSNFNYSAGQFAFFTFPSLSKKEQHPFTISNHPSENGLRITVKNLGDYTKDIGSKLNDGDKVMIEGPYGHFTSIYIKEYDQIWIAGGIGITPFLALSKEIYTNSVKLYWCVNKDEEAVYAQELLKLAEENESFDFEVWTSSDRGHLKIESLGITDPADKAYLICGPEQMKQSLYKELNELGVNNKNIYDEEFAFR